MRRRGLLLTNGRCGLRRLRGENATRRPSNSRVLMAGVVCREMEGGMEGACGTAFDRVATDFGCVHDRCRLVSGGLSLRRRRVVSDAVRLVAVGASLRGGKGERKVHRFSSKTEGFLSKVEAFCREGRGLRAESARLLGDGRAAGRRRWLSSRGEGAIVERRADYRWSRGWLIR